MKNDKLAGDIFVDLLNEYIGVRQEHVQKAQEYLFSEETGKDMLTLNAHLLHRLN